jgi:hypothetical protein
MAAALSAGMLSFNRLALVLGLALALTGCRASSLQPVAPVVDGPGGVRVLLRNQHDEVFRLEVINYGQYPIWVDRDRVVLFTAGGPRTRLPGGIGNLYEVPPGGRHGLNVRFHLGGIHTGERVALSLAGAVTMNGQPLMVPALEFVAD